MAAAKWLGAREAASRARVGEKTWTAYVARAQAPQHGRRNPDTGKKEWEAGVVDAWLSNRPGPGARTDVARERQAFRQAGLVVLMGSAHDDSLEDAAERFVRSADPHEVTGRRGERFEYSFSYDDIPRIVDEAKAIELP